MLRLRNYVLPLLRLRAASPPLSPIHHRAWLLFSTSPAPFSLEDYLVAACGLAPDQAREASKRAFEEASKKARKPFNFSHSRSRLNSASNPDAVLALLSDVGLSRADIAGVVAADPLILRSSVKKIGPRLLALRDRLGLSSLQIYQLLLVGSEALRSCELCPKIEFLISFFGSFEKLLVATKRCSSILRADPRSLILQLRQCGLSVRDIVQMCSHYPMMLEFNPERVKDFVLRAEALGVPRSSPMFKHAMAVVARINKEKIAARLEFLKSTLGCSEDDVAIAVSKMPTILGVSEERLLPKILFLLNEVGMEPLYIVKRPTLLGLSLEKRLIPRHRVMKLLKEKGLLKSEMSFFSIAKIGEQTFRSKFIDSHKDSVPWPADAYAAASAGDVPPAIPTLTSI